MANRTSIHEIERKVFFFRSDIGSDDGGKPHPFDPTKAIRSICRLPFDQSEQSRYLSDDDTGVICLLTQNSINNNSIQFCKVRRSGLPQIENSGNLTDLNLDLQSGLLEATHIVFFANNIVGVEHNHHGPRVSRLGYYLRVKSGNQVPLAKFHPLIRSNVVEELEFLKELRLVDLRIQPSYAEIVRRADSSLGAAFQAATDVVREPEQIELVLRMGPESRKWGLERLLGPIRSLVIREDLRDNVSKFQVKGRHSVTDKVETIDLLRDKLVLSRKMLRLGDRSRALDPSSAFDAIRSAYDELKDKLEVSASISL